MTTTTTPALKQHIEQVDQDLRWSFLRAARYAHNWWRFTSRDVEAERAELERALECAASPADRARLVRAAAALLDGPARYGSCTITRAVAEIAGLPRPAVRRGERVTKDVRAVAAAAIKAARALLWLRGARRMLAYTSTPYHETLRRFHRAPYSAGSPPRGTVRKRRLHVHDAQRLASDRDFRDRKRAEAWLIGTFGEPSGGIRVAVTTDPAATAFSVERFMERNGRYMNHVARFHISVTRRLVRALDDIGDWCAEHRIVPLDVYERDGHRVVVGCRKRRGWHFDDPAEHPMDAVDA